MAGVEALAPLAGALDGRFLRRTFAATVICALLVALFAASYGRPAWAARYLIFAVWPMALYALTGLTLQAMFERAKFKGMLCIFLKIAGLAGLYAVYMFWPVPNIAGEPDRAQVAAMFFGIATPFAVFMLRFFGFLSELQRKRMAVGSAGPVSIEKANSHP